MGNYLFDIQKIEDWLTSGYPSSQEKSVCVFRFMSECNLVQFSMLLIFSKQLLRVYPGDFMRPLSAKKWFETGL